MEKEVSSLWSSLVFLQRVIVSVLCEERSALTTQQIRILYIYHIYDLIINSTTDDKIQKEHTRYSLQTMGIITPSFYVIEMNPFVPETATKILKEISKSKEFHLSIKNSPDSKIGKYNFSELLSKVFSRNGIPTPSFKRFENYLNDLKDLGIVSSRKSTKMRVKNLWYIEPQIKKELIDNCLK